MEEVTCNCGHEFEAEEWRAGNCPKCGTYYTWEEWCTQFDYGSYVIFEKNDSKKAKEILK